MSKLIEKIKGDLKESILLNGGAAVGIAAICIVGGTIARKPVVLVFGLTAATGLGSGALVAWNGSRLVDRLAAEFSDCERAIETAKQEGLQQGRTERDSQATDRARVQWENTRQALVNSHQQALDGLKLQHQRNVGELNRQHRQQLEAAEAAALASGTAENEAKWQKYHETVVNNYKTQLQALEGKLRAEYDVKVGELEAQVRQWEAKRATIDRDLRTIHRWEVESAAQKGKLIALEEKTRSHNSEIAKLQREFEDKIGKLERTYREKIQSLSDMLPVHYQKGWNEAYKEFGLAEEKYKLRIATLETQLDKKRKHEKFDKLLPELSDLIGKERKPLIVVGSQGSGKALLTAEVARIYADGAGIIPFVLDVSEAGNPESSWHKLGIPATDNPYIFLEFLTVLRDQIGANSCSLPFRTDKEKYDAAPAIVPIVDEALTAFDALEKEYIEVVRECLRAFESRGSKRKVFPIACTTDNQIQNLKPKGISLWNTGVFRAYYIAYLNDGLLSRISKEELENNLTLRDYIEIHGDNFISALQTIDNRGKTLRPFRHVSHHSKQRGNSVHPVRIPEVNLADLYPWMPRSFREIYAQYHRATDDGGMAVASGGAAVANGRGGNGVQPLEPSLHKETTDSVAVANNGVSTATADIDPETIERILDCKMRGMNQADTIYEVWGMKKNGRSPRWKEYREIYNRVIEEYKP